MIEETSTVPVIVGLSVTVAVTVEFMAAKAEVTLPAAKKAIGPEVGNPVKDEP